jgi:hypothetical protein
MSRVITFSRVFPTYHPKKGEPTYFVEKLSKGFPEYSADDFIALPSDPHKGLFNLIVLAIDKWMELAPKYHTIRSGSKWKVGDKFSPRVWSGKPYSSKMITIAPDIEIKKVWDITITTQDDDGENDWSFIEINGKSYTVYSDEYLSDTIKELAKNDGLSTTDLFEWFKLDRSRTQRENGEDKIFKGQIISWTDSINY